MTAKTLIIVGEDADDFDLLRAELMDEHDPQSALECELVERLAGILWRLRRVPFFEAAIMDARHYQAGKMDMPSIYRASEQTEEEDEEEADWQKSVHFGYALINDATFGDALGKLARHEVTLMNALTKTLLLRAKLTSSRLRVLKPMPRSVRLPPSATPSVLPFMTGSGLACAKPKAGSLRHP
ncbi:MAG: hypothetical protein WBW37_06690 [Methyloceanibacter sp.]